MKFTAEALNELFVSHAFVAKNPSEVGGLIAAMLAATEVYGYEFPLNLVRYEQEAVTMPKLDCSEKYSILIILIAKHGGSKDTLSKLMMLMTSNLVVESGLAAADFAKAVAPKQMADLDKVEFQMYMTDFATSALLKHTAEKGVAN